MAKSYTLEAGEKASQVMVGTAHTLMWGDLVTKEQISVSAFLNTLAEDFVPLHDVKILFLAPTQQMPPLERPTVHVKLEEILMFFEMAGTEPMPEETHVRRLEPVEAILGSFYLEGSILKSPLANLHTMLLVSKDPYLHLYQGSVRHVAKPWLGTMAANAILVRRESLIMAVR
ncbi:MAG: hypothetical protein PHY79_18560 [Anaerolineae bacterium]|nr:hypothetical protein [Anaerolineae bacterium]MDX9831873.1 hypothetical protein [Anaerolineae bacterium]